MKLNLPLNKLFIFNVLLLAFLLLFFLSVENRNIKSRLVGYLGFNYLIQERKKVQHKAQIIALNHAIPDFSSFVHFIYSSIKESSAAQEYSIYYKRVVDVFPDLSDGYAVLGFLDYYAQDEASAIHNFQEAIRIKSDSFYPYYNLGLIYLKNAEYPKAVLALSKALECDPKKTIEHIYASRMYIQLIGAMTPDQKKNVASLKNDYKEALKFLTIAKYCVEKKVTQKINLNQLNLKIF